MKQHLIVVFLVTVMASAVFGAVCLTTPADAQHVSTVVTLTTPTSATVGQAYSVSGKIEIPAGRTVTSDDGDIQLYRATGGTTDWTWFTTVNIDSNGNFATTDTQRSTGTVAYLAKYAGSSTLMPSSSLVKNVVITEAGLVGGGTDQKKDGNEGTAQASGSPSNTGGGGLLPNVQLPNIPFISDGGNPTSSSDIASGAEQESTNAVGSIFAFLNGLGAFGILALLVVLIVALLIMYALLGRA